MALEVVEEKRLVPIAQPVAQAELFVQVQFEIRLFRGVHDGAELRTKLRPAADPVRRAAEQLARERRTRVAVAALAVDLATLERAAHKHAEHAYHVGHLANAFANQEVVDDALR